MCFIFFKNIFSVAHGVFIIYFAARRRYVLFLALFRGGPGSRRNEDGECATQTTHMVCSLPL